MPVLYLLCIFHMAAAAIAEGSCLLRAWSGCSVITGFLPTHEFWCNQRRHCCRCPGTGSTWHKSCLTLHMPAAHSLCCKLVLAVAWVQGSRSSTAAHTECGTILIQQYQGVQALRMLCGCKVMLYSPRKATASAAASLCSLVCDCYRFDHSPGVVRAGQHKHLGMLGGLGTLHT
jgi:hypothetical protein